MLPASWDRVAARDDNSVALGNLSKYNEGKFSRRTVRKSPLTNVKFRRGVPKTRAVTAVIFILGLCTIFPAVGINAEGRFHIVEFMRSTLASAVATVVITWSASSTLASSCRKVFLL